MKQKANFNKNRNNDKLKIALMAVLSLFILLIIIKSVKNVTDSLHIQQQSEDNQALIYKSIKDYNTLGDLINSYNCKFISKEESNNLIKVYLNFDVDLYTENISNENHFLNISKAIAQFLKYKDFELIDENKNIDIEIQCEESNIVEFKINGDLNYYLNHNSEINKNKSTIVTNFTIQSDELMELIDNNWDESKINWGTKESTCNKYNIYFEEGIEYKNIAKNVYNLVFTDNYKKQVAGGLTIDASPEEVKSALGNPTFKNNENIYGYLGENNYLFFDFINKEISVYPVKKVTKEEENKLMELINAMNENSDIKTFALNLTSSWVDYDVYDYDSNYVDLRYTLKGVELLISSSSLNNGIFIYQNYNGNRNISDLDNVYIKDIDSVFEEEINRSSKKSLCRIEQGEFSEEYYKRYLGEDFSVRFNKKEGSDNVYYYGVKFYSRDKSWPDSELDKNLEISSYIWIDNKRFVYSIDNEGIYIYDCITRTSQKIKDLEEKIIINSLDNNTIIYNNESRLSIATQ